MALVIVVVVGLTLMAFKIIPFQSISTSNTPISCTEDPIESISSNFSAENIATIPTFETIFQVPRIGTGRKGFIDVSDRDGIWTVDNKLAYVVTYHQNAGIPQEDVVYYDGKEIDSVPTQFITPIPKVTDRLAYYTKDKIVFGNETYAFPQLASVNDAKEIDAKLYIRGSGGTYYDGKKLLENEDLLSIDGRAASLKTISLGTRSIIRGGQKTEVQNTKSTFIYEGKEYGTEYDGFTNKLPGTDPVLCNGKPVYLVRKGLLGVDEDYREYLVYDGKIVNKPYAAIGHFEVIGGTLVFKAITKDRKEVLVQNGEEIGTQYHSIANFFSHNGHLVYLAYDVPNDTALATYYVVEDGQLLYKTAQDEQLRSEIIAVGQKLALLVRGKDTSEKKVIYDGAEVLSQYAENVRTIFDLNGKLGALIEDTSGQFIVVEGAGKEPYVQKTTTSGVVSNQTKFAEGLPSITEISGPTSLPSRTSGTWTVKTSNPKSEKVTYIVDWKDYDARDAAGLTYPVNLVQSGFAEEFSTAAFSHAYKKPGVYEITVYPTSLSTELYIDTNWGKSVVLPSIKMTVTVTE